MAYIHGLLRIVLYANKAFKTKKVVSYIMPTANVGNIMLLVGPLFFSSKPMKMTLDLFNLDQLIPVTSKVNQNIMLTELLLSTKSLRIVSYQYLR